MKDQKNSGFSLIEVIIAMAIFAIGSLGLYGMQFNSARWNTRANQQTNAVTVANQVIEQLMQTDYSDTPLSVTEATKPEDCHKDKDKCHNYDDSKLKEFADRLQFAHPPGPDGLIKSVQWTVNQVDDGMKQVDVTVEYGARERQVNLSFLRVKMI
ncbi:MAG: prepilin-type N-terminal cleavage/methylation domain-containing protein [Candidatus Electrothrix sp. YB6]